MSAVSDKTTHPAVRSWRGAVDQFSRKDRKDTRGARALLAALNARTPRIPEAQLGEHTTAESLRLYAREERAPGEPLDPVLNLAAAALSQPSFERLYALAQAWDPAGDADESVADAMQVSISHWWANAPSAKEMLMLVGALDPGARTSPKLPRVVARSLVALAGRIDSDEAEVVHAIAAQLVAWLEDERDASPLRRAADLAATYRAEFNARYRRLELSAERQVLWSFVDSCASTIGSMQTLLLGPSIANCSGLLDALDWLWGRWGKRADGFELDRTARFVDAAAITRQEIHCPELRACLAVARKTALE